MRHELLLQNDLPTPLGTLHLAAVQTGGRGIVPDDPLRVYGRYAVVCILQGHGTYRDVNKLSCSVKTGDVILVFPELAHWYGPRPGEHWDELYLTFDGPVFGLWRQVGLLSAAHPVRPAPPHFATRLRQIIAPPERATRLDQMNQFLSLLSQLSGDITSLSPPDDCWADRARALLDTDLEMPLDWDDVASALEMSYENFRKRFVREVGVSPARYRASRRIRAASELLRYAPHLTNRQAALSLGFADEYHFSRRFTEATGYTPREFRTRCQVEGKAHQAQQALQEHMSVTVRELGPNDEADLLDLRARILRPGQPVEKARFSGDDLPTTVHFGAFDPAGTLVGICTVMQHEGWQLRGMAVDAGLQGKGIGAALLRFVHDRARRESWEPLWCNARASAVDFYARCGWTVTSDDFDIPGIGPHYVMQWQPQ